MCPTNLSEQLLECSSRADLSPELQEHLEQCADCCARVQEFFLFEKRLRGLALGSMPALDLSASIMSRLPLAERQPQRWPWLVWSPLLLFLTLLLPDPAGLPDLFQLALSWSWPALPEIAWPNWTLPALPDAASFEILCPLLTLVVLGTTWKWRSYAQS